MKIISKYFILKKEFKLSLTLTILPLRHARMDLCCTFLNLLTRILSFIYKFQLTFKIHLSFPLLAIGISTQIRDEAANNKMNLDSFSLFNNERLRSDIKVEASNYHSTREAVKSLFCMPN